MHFLKKYLLLIALLPFNFLLAQNYQAIHGSSYAGSLGPGSNPASIVHVPYAWDITPVSFQLKQSTNAFKINNFSLLSKPDSITISAQNGIKKRFVMANQDVRLMNVRLNLNAKTAIAFGANIRNYITASSSKTNGQDTLLTLSDFMKINSSLVPLAGKLTANTWAELYTSYAHTIIDDGDRLLNAGLTIKATRGIAGGYAVTEAINYVPQPDINIAGYVLTSGSLQFGYSDNFDKIDSNKTAAANRKLFLKENRHGVSADLGMEYIVLTNEDKAGAGDYAYETKIGIAVMDIGRNRYRHGSRSRVATSVKPGIADTVLENKFSSVKNFDEFNDSLASIAGAVQVLRGDFFIYQPTRLLINIDRHIMNNFFLNAEITIPLVSLVPKKIRSINELNLLAVTPRWEIKSLGAYLPVLLNSKKQLSIGGAFKAGPILMGTHNLANLFAKNKLQNGGSYLALTIRPTKIYDRMAHYPKEKLSKKEQRLLNCPTF